MADQPAPSAFTLSGAAVQATSRGTDALAEEVVSLFDQWRDRLLRYIVSFGLPVQDAEDVVQEVFLALYRHLQQERSRSNLRAWIFRVAHNLALKQRSQTQAHSLPAHDETDPSPNPEDQAARGQTQQRVSAVVSALPEQDRRCLVLRAEGLRYREIAEVLDISLGSVSLSLERSLTRLARAVQR